MLACQNHHDEHVIMLILAFSLNTVELLACIEILSFREKTDGVQKYSGEPAPKLII